MLMSQKEPGINPQTPPGKNNVLHYLKQFVLNSTLIVISLMFALLLCEGVFFTLNKLYPVEPIVINETNGEPNEERKVFTQYHSIYGHAGVPDIHEEFFGELISQNSKGLRGPERDYQKPEDVERVVFIGDSQTWGWAVGDKQTIPYYFEKIANIRNRDKHFEAINLGVSGYGLDQSYLRLITEGLRYQPDTVVLTFFAENDTWETTNTFAYGIEKPYMYEKQEGQWCVSNVPPHRASGWPTDNIGFIVKNQLNIDIPVLSFGGLTFDLAESNIVTYFKNRNLNSSLVGLWGADDSDPIQAIEKYVGCMEREPGPTINNQQDRLRHVARLILKIRNTAEQAGANFVFVGKPLEEDYKNNRLSYEYQYFLNELSAAGVNIVEMMGVMKAEQVSPKQAYMDFGHVKPRINHMIADNVYKAQYAQPAAPGALSSR